MRGFKSFITENESSIPHHLIHKVKPDFAIYMGKHDPPPNTPMIYDLRGSSPKPILESNSETGTFLDDLPEPESSKHLVLVDPTTRDHIYAHGPVGDEENIRKRGAQEYLNVHGHAPKYPDDLGLMHIEKSAVPLLSNHSWTKLPTQAHESGFLAIDRGRFHEYSHPYKNGSMDPRPFPKLKKRRFGLVDGSGSLREVFDDYQSAVHHRGELALYHHDDPMEHRSIWALHPSISKELGKGIFPKFQTKSERTEGGGDHIHDFLESLPKQKPAKGKSTDIVPAEPKVSATANKKHLWIAYHPYTQRILGVGVNPLHAEDEAKRLGTWHRDMRIAPANPQVLIDYQSDRRMHVKMGDTNQLLSDPKYWHKIVHSNPGSNTSRFHDQAHSPEHQWKVDSDSRTAIQQYSGSYYQDINRSFRNGRIDTYGEGIMKGLYAGVTKHPIVVFHGSKVNLGAIPPNPRTGKLHFTNWGIASTSTSKDIAKSFASSKSTLVQVSIPAGMSTRSIMDHSTNRSENEVLIPPHSHWIIDPEPMKDEDSGHKILHGRLVFDGKHEVPLTREEAESPK